MASQWYPLRVAVLRDEVREARAELVELRGVRDALEADVHDLQAAAAELLEERDRFRAHSVMLNTVAWRLAEALGDVGPDDNERESDGDVPAAVDRLTGERDDWQARARFYADLLMTDDQQALCAEWHASRFQDHDRWLILAKLTEEVGELARAVIAEHEGRPGRGDVGQEAAQCVLVLMTLIGRFYPERDLLADVRGEYERIVAIPGHPGGTP